MEKKLAAFQGKKKPFDKTKLIHDYIQNQAMEFPNNQAVTDEKITVTYKELNDKANQLAHYLILNGYITTGKLIGVCFNPCVDMIVAVLAIIKAGGAYLPIDLNYPTEYINMVLNDANPGIILTNIRNCVKYRQVINVNNLNLYGYSIANLNITLNAGSLAYVLYTSGSTGKPKGVMVPHMAVNNHMLWMQEEFQFTENDRILLKTPLAFDPSVWEIFLPLFTGARLIIAPLGAHIDPHILVHQIIEHAITTIQFVPTILDKFLRNQDLAKCHSLSKIFVGGESLLSSTKKLFFEKMTCLLINLYGPTETTIDITSHIVKNNQEDIETNHLGKPIYNTKIYILDDKKNLCVQEQVGELCVSGDCLGLGYLNNQEATKTSFIDNIFCPGEKLYKTGDMVRSLHNGLIEYIERKDRQIKINGMRVELQALTDKINQYPDVQDCFVFKKVMGDSCAYLACYLICKKGKEINLDLLKKSIEKIFHSSLIPKDFIFVESFPLLPNGKIDVNRFAKRDLEEIIPDKDASKKDILSFLMQCSENLLNIQDISASRSLSEYHIDSLFGLILISSIEKKYNVVILMQEFLRSKNLDQLSSLTFNKLRGKSIKPRSNPIIILKNNGHKTPLFLVHPIGGTVFWYSYIAKYFDIDRPLYGIQDPGIESDGFLFHNLEEMADYYLSCIKDVQPNGPYIIGGASFGATVAVEICRKLQKEEVLAIPVLDGWAVYPDDLRNDNYFKESMQKQQNDWKVKFCAYNYTEFEKIFQRQQYLLSLLFKYQMKKIDHKIFVFKCKEIMSIFSEINSYDNNWSKYTKYMPYIINVDGNHETMFQEPYVKNLSSRLSEILHKTDVEHSHFKMKINQLDSKCVSTPVIKLLGDRVY